MDLGQKIIDTVPENEKDKFQSPLIEGFNNFNVSLEEVRRVLNSDYFKDKHILGVGKTEWANVKWTGQSIAEKKHVINSAKIVFTAATSPAEVDRARNSLKKAGVSSILLDCSDAHWYSHSKDKDRLGNSLTWIKADPTFRGLKHVLIDAADRIYVGQMPSEKSFKAKHTTRIIDSVTIRKSTQIQTVKLYDKWFDAKINFNDGLVAIIGYKGSGKSALTDVLGLVGGSNTELYWSFLHPAKFRKKPEYLAQYFNAEGTWTDGSKRECNLAFSIDPKTIPLLKYIPQDYFEKICNQIPSVEESAFDVELKSVIFSHVAIADRLGKASFDELLEHKTNQLDSVLTKQSSQLSETNQEIARLEKQLLPLYRESLTNELIDLKERLSGIKASRPKTVRRAKGGGATSTRLETAKKKLTSIHDEIAVKEKARHSNAEMIAEIEKLIATIENLNQEVQNIISKITEPLSMLGHKIEDILVFKAYTKPLETKKNKLETVRKNIDKALDRSMPTGLHKRLEIAMDRVASLQSDLDAPNRKYEAYRQQLSEWNAEKEAVIGDENTPKTLAYVKKKLSDIKNVPGQLDRMYQQRRQLATGILNILAKKKQVLVDLYAPVQNFISDHPDIGKEIDIRFGVSIENVGFVDDFLSRLNLAKSGSFKGVREAKQELAELVTAHDPNDPVAAIAFAEEISNRLLHSKEGPEGQINDVTCQLRKGQSVESLYDYIYTFGYLQPRYTLCLGEKELRQLSPGERGAMLIVFYLLVDKDKNTLVIDQPEHNLDNGTVTRLLVPALKQAKQNRQVIVITHNPILAVVCNADQVIVAELDQRANNTVTYSSGSLENPEINRRIVDILEGTIKAFDNRNMKYIRDYLGNEKG